MVAANFPLHSSPLLDLARAGDFSALAYWINRVLIPDGFYARVRGGAASGCIDVCVEFPAPRTATQNELQTNIIRRICHQLWQLNSQAIHGVKVSASLPGRTDAIWQQSVRIVTPANQQLPWSGAAAFDWGAVLRPVVRGAASLRAWVRSRYKALRLLLLAGSAVAAFTLGSWFSSSASLEWLDRPPSARVAPLTPPAIVETVPAPEPGSFAPATPTIPSPDRRSSRSGLARIRSIVDKIAHPQIVAIEPPAIRADRDDVVLLFGGDVSFSGPLAGDNARAFAELDVLSAADVTSLTLGSPLSVVARDEAEFSAAAPADDAADAASPETTNRAEPIAAGAIAALQDAGIDAINLANGRILDDGDRGLDATLDRLAAAEIATLGAGRSADEAARARIVEVKGVKIAYLGYATADYTIARDRRSGVNEALYERIRADVTTLRDRVDWIVVNYHWGETRSSYPARWQAELARQSIDAGADAIVGHSPNALQGAETYRDRPIVYSLGKLLNNNRYGFGGEAALLRLRLDGEAIAADFVPIELWDGRPVAAAPDSARWIVQRIEDLSQGFDRPLARLAEDVDGRSPDIGTSTDRRSRARGAIATNAAAPTDMRDTTEPAAAPLGLAIDTVGRAIAPPIVPQDTAPKTTRNTARNATPDRFGAPPEPISFDLSRPLAPLAGRLSVEQSLDRLDPAVVAALQPLPDAPAEITFQHPALDRERRDLASELKALELDFSGLANADRDAAPLSAIEVAPSERADGESIAPSEVAAASPESHELPDSSDSPDSPDSPFSTAPLIAYDPPPLRSPADRDARPQLDGIGRATGSWTQKAASPSFSIQTDAPTDAPTEERAEEREGTAGPDLPRW